MYLIYCFTSLIDMALIVTDIAGTTHRFVRLSQHFHSASHVSCNLNNSSCDRISLLLEQLQVLQKNSDGSSSTIVDLNTDGSCSGRYEDGTNCIYSYIDWVD